MRSVSATRCLLYRLRSLLSLYSLVSDRFCKQKTILLRNVEKLQSQWGPDHVSLMYSFTKDAGNYFLDSLSEF